MNLLSMELLTNYNNIAKLTLIVWNHFFQAIKNHYFASSIQLVPNEITTLHRTLFYANIFYK
jgi:hypothetical protein